jgi:hypothetical protein
VITLLPPEPETAPRDLTKIAAGPGDRVIVEKGGIAPQ